MGIMSTTQLFDQLDTFSDMPVARKTDPETSKQAALKINYKSKRAKILKILSEYPNGLATHEIATKLRELRDSVSSQMMPLQRGGWVAKTGHTRLNHSTNMWCEIWKATDKYLSDPILRNSTKTPTPREIAKRQVLDAAKRIQDAYRDIHVVATSMIFDFSSGKHLVSRYNECSESPIGVCVWLLDDRKPKLCRYCDRVWKGGKR